MTIQKGLIWDYYDCTHTCYLFGKYELPCFFMALSGFLAIIILILIGVPIGFLIYDYWRNKKNEI